MPSLRRSLRALRRSPGFLAVAIPSVALALGVATAVFAVVAAVLRPETPFRDVASLHYVAVHLPGIGTNKPPPPVQESMGALRLRSSAVSEAALMAVHWRLVEAGRFAADVAVRHVGANYFAMLGVRPELGRLFTEASERQDEGANVVVSAELWQRAFGWSRTLDTKTVRVGGASFRVIGVAPRGVNEGDGTGVWMVASDARFATLDRSVWREGVVRLREGVPTERLREEADAVAATMSRDRGEWRGLGIRFRPVMRPPEALRDIHMALILAASALVAIACANLANLFLARALAGERETAIRLTLGARRRDIAADVLLECALVALAGGALGLMLARWGLSVLAQRLPTDIPFLGTLQFSTDWRVVAFAAGASLAMAVLFGLGPALHVAGADLARPLKDGSGAVIRRTRGRYSLLVVVEVMLALTLVAGAGLLTTAARHVRDRDYGYNRSALVRADIQTRRGGDTLAVDRRRFAAGAVAGARALPGVRGAAWEALPAHGGLSVTSAVTGGGNHTLYRPSLAVVSADYLRTLGIDVLSGRDFAPGDEEGKGVAIVDERAARALWPGDSPIGQRLTLGAASGGAGWVPVVGVARHVSRDETSFDFHEEARANIYLAGVEIGAGFSVVANAAAGRLPTAVLGLQLMVNDLVPSGWARPVQVQREADERVAIAHRFVSRTFLGLAALALAACAAGVFCVQSYAVSCRQREYALRLALGASTAAIARDVVREAAVMVLAGTAAGAFLAMWSSQWLEPFLFDVFRVDALTLAVAEGVLMATALAAALVPALRARRCSPLSLLRAS